MNPMSTTEHTAGTCIICSSSRVARVTGKVCDSFGMTMGGREIQGPVPSGLGLGEGDYLDFELCLDCTKIQKTSPVRRIAKLDAPLPKGTRQAARERGAPLQELQSMTANWPGQCSCGVVYVQGTAIDYSLTIRQVVGCPCCNAKRAAKAA